MLTFSEIEAARRRIRDSVYLTPFAHTETLSKLAGCRVHLKLENLQMTGSFKERGALNKLLTTAPEVQQKGIVTASAGNHAQGVAYHCQRLGVAATIVMPEGTPLIKVSRTRDFGANVVLSGATYDDASAEAARLAREESLELVHPFDDLAVMAGQGTMGLEILEQNPYVDVVVVSIGGGGLVAGVAVALKETNPKIQVIGVEAAKIASMKASVAAGAVVTLPAARTIADGIAVRTVGEQTFPVVARYVDDIVTVDEEEIANAILLLLEGEKTVAEGAGAAPLAALVHGKLRVEGKRVGLVVSGGNIDVNVVSRIIERGLVKSGRLMRAFVRISDQVGVLADLTGLVSRMRASILQIHHNRAFSRQPLGGAIVELVLETRGFSHIEDIARGLRDAGYEVELG
ncbi:MAG: threonine ammonia-lyase [Deltaproteobacteria bacterium]|nr:threonine ammonia-lyase [Deltaproteobacteria bacterium]